jgi:hypothetical protein
MKYIFLLSVVFALIAILTDHTKIGSVATLINALIGFVNSCKKCL